MAFIRLKQYRDAITTFETAMETQPDDQCGYNLIVCHVACQDAEGAKHAFQKLVSSRASTVMASTEDLSLDENGNEHTDDHAVFTHDPLHQLNRQR